MYKISKSLIRPKMTPEEKERIHRDIEDFIDRPIISQWELDLLFKDEILITHPSGISVDWKKFEEMDRTYYGREHIIGHAVDYLKHLNILSPVCKGNYGVYVDGGILCNPRFHILPAFFTNERDATLFRDAIAEGAQYGVYVVKGV